MTRPFSHRLVRSVVGLAMVLLAACSITEVEENPLAGAQIEGKGHLDDAETSKLDAEKVTDAALRDVEDYWTRTFEGVFGEEFEPVQGGFIPYGPDTGPVPCGPGLEYDEIRGNAFYCPSDDLIAWDQEALIDPLFDQFGGFTVGIVFAHEYAHAIQSRTVDSRLPTVVLELQADCYAGAWTQDVEEGNAEFFEVSSDDLDASIAGFLQLRDGIGTSADDPQAHGTGFDRIGAFQEGLENGAERCETYEDSPPTVFEFPFLSRDDLINEGNLPFDEVAPLSVRDLEDYWTVAFADVGEVWDPVDSVIAYDPAIDDVECDDRTFDEERATFASFYCVDDDSVQFDNANLMPELYEIGDFAMAFEIARQYAFAAQVRLGSTEDGLDAELQADCFVGAYVASTIKGFGTRDSRKLTSSPGDLDEAIISFLANAENNAKLTAFERFAAFRRGVLGAGELNACEL